MGDISGDITINSGFYLKKWYEKCYWGSTWICKRHRKYLNLNTHTSINFKIFKKIKICDYVNKYKMSREYWVDLNSFIYNNVNLQTNWWFSMFVSVSFFISTEILLLLLSQPTLKQKHIFGVCDLNTNAGFFQILWIFSSCFVIGSQLCTIYHTEEAITFISLGTEKFDKVDIWHIELW